MRRTRTDKFPDGPYDCVGGPLDGQSVLLPGNQTRYPIAQIDLERPGEWQNVYHGEYRLEWRGPRVVPAWYDNTPPP